MDQTKSEDQIFHRYQQECSADADLDRIVCLPTPGIYQVPVETEQKHATNYFVYCSLNLFEKRDLMALLRGDPGLQ